jgi:hypothetical protein
MATTIRIYNQADNRYYTVTVDSFGTSLDTNGTDMSTDYYLKITTSMRVKSTGAAFPQYVIRYLTDVPPGYAAAETFTDLINSYIDYFIVQANLGMSSSSSSSSSSNSSSSSSYIDNWSSSSSSSSSSP